MAIPLDPPKIVSFEELLMSQVVQQEALTRLLIMILPFVLSGAKIKYIGFRKKALLTAGGGKKG
jgi:hypothetical protein